MLTRFIWGELWGLVTFRDPGKTSLKTSFQEFIPLRNATDIAHPRP